MEMPNIPHAIKDPNNQVLYVVMAYREISREEAVQAIRAFNAQSGRLPKKGSRITIITTLGAANGL